jgi:hypothetical protein
MWSAGRMTERRSDTGKRSMVITMVPWGEDDLIESRLLADDSKKLFCYGRTYRLQIIVSKAI